MTKTPEERIAAMKAAVEDRRRLAEEAEARRKAVYEAAMADRDALNVKFMPLDGLPLRGGVVTVFVSTPTYRPGAETATDIQIDVCRGGASTTNRMIQFECRFDPGSMLYRIYHDDEEVNPDAALDLATAVVEREFHV